MLQKIDAEFLLMVALISKAHSNASNALKREMPQNIAECMAQSAKRKELLPAAGSTQHSLFKCLKCTQKRNASNIAERIALGAKRKELSPDTSGLVRLGISHRFTRKIPGLTEHSALKCLKCTQLFIFINIVQLRWSCDMQANP